MFRFYGMGGEIGIRKDQILSIRKAGEKDQGGVTFTDAVSPLPTAKSPPQGAAVPPQPIAPSAPSPEEEREKEEKEYQESLRSVTQQIQELRDLYSQSIRGTTSPEPTQLVTDEQIKAHNDAVISRFRDAQNNPSEPAPVKVLTPSPFSTLPPTTEVFPAGQVGVTYGSPPPYTERQKELSDLRNQAIRLEKERERLINEMRQKNFRSGSLFLE